MLTWEPKDPNDITWREIDWADPDGSRLEAGETLTASTLTVVTGTIEIDQGDSGFTSQGLVTVWLSGGADDEVSTVLNRVTTSLGQQFDQTVRIRTRSN